MTASKSDDQSMVSSSCSAIIDPATAGEGDEIEEILKVSVIINQHIRSPSSLWLTGLVSNEQIAYKDTRLIRAWRFSLMGLLISTGLVVTYTAYKFLRAEEFNNFETAFDQFSRTISVAAVDQQNKVRSALQGLAAVVSTTAILSGATWPYVTIPFFERHATNYRSNQAGIEFFATGPLVKHAERERYEAWTFENFQEMVQEGYSTAGVVSDEKDPASFTSHLFGAGPQGKYKEVEKEEYFPVWQWSPLPYTYGQINWNAASVPEYAAANAAAVALGNETVIAAVRPYANAIGNSISAEEHAAMHSKLGNSKTEHPHSVFIHPILKDVTNSSSEVVGIIAAGVAWDAALQDLLPEGVWGVYAVIENDCDQTYTYEIDGAEAFFLGEGDSHEMVYDDYEVVVDLSLHLHPEFETTPGHCQYQIHVYPSQRFFQSYQSNTPERFAVVVSVSFVVVVAIVFFVYDVLVQRRNFKLIANAARTNAIVASMFPAAVRDEVINQKDTDSSSMLADLYPNCTV